VRNPAALFSSRQRRMSTVKIGSGCLVWVDSVEKLSKGWNPGSKLKPLSSRLATQKSGSFGPRDP
jgi:hypothetical protein